MFIFWSGKVQNEELWDTVHLFASLWALVSKQFQDSSFFYVNFTGMGF